jgi:hypothetical protein
MKPIPVDGMTAEERKAAARAAFTEMLNRIEEHICVSCLKPVEKYEEVGRCVYAEPCGHRQYQGRAPL